MDKPEKTIYAKFVHPNSGYDIEVESGKQLQVGAYYEVAGISMGQSHTSIQFKNFKGAFSSVQFEFFDADKQPIDIYSMPEFNHYLGMFK